MFADPWDPRIFFVVSAASMGVLGGEQKFAGSSVLVSPFPVFFFSKMVTSLKLPFMHLKIWVVVELE